MRKIILVFIIVMLSIIIFLILIKIYKIKRNILGVSVVKINRENINFNTDSILKYFFEPKPNTEEKSAPWIKWVQAIYTINSDSLNERYDYLLDKPKDSFRIITLGDSFTFGIFVDTQLNWPERLEDILNQNLSCNNIRKFEVINLGEYGYDIQYAVERYRIRGVKYNPDLVIWLLKDDDFEEINEYFRENESKYRKEMEESGEFKKLSEQGHPYPVIIKMQQDMQKIYKKIGADNILKIQKEYMYELKKYYAKKLILTTFTITKEEYKKILLEFANTQENTFYNDKLSDIFHINDATFSPYDLHPNRKGHQIIAEDLFNYLISSSVISCDK